MRSHDLARELLKAPDGEIRCSVDISTGEHDADDRCFGEFADINSLPSSNGFGSNYVDLNFDGEIQKPIRNDNEY